MRSVILGVSKKHVRGAMWDRKGRRIRYLGHKSHWTCYYLDEFGTFHAEKVSVGMVTLLKARKQRILTYRCDFCLTKFRSNLSSCPSCGSRETTRIKRKKQAN